MSPYYLSSQCDNYNFFNIFFFIIVQLIFFDSQWNHSCRYYSRFFFIKHPMTSTSVAAPLSQLRRRWLRLLFILQQSASFSSEKVIFAYPLSFTKFLYELNTVAIGITMPLTAFRNSLLVGSYDCSQLA